MVKKPVLNMADDPAGQRYINTRDLEMRFNNSIIIHNKTGLPHKIIEIREMDNMVGWTLDDKGKQTRTRIRPNEISLDMELGYVNIMYDKYLSYVMYLERVPHRRNSQGLSQGNVFVNYGRGLPYSYSIDYLIMACLTNKDYTIDSTTNSHLPIDKQFNFNELPDFFNSAKEYFDSHKFALHVPFGYALSKNVAIIIQENTNKEKNILKLPFQVMLKGTQIGFYDFKKRLLSLTNLSIRSIIEDELSEVGLV